MILRRQAKVNTVEYLYLEKYNTVIGRHYPSWNKASFSWFQQLEIHRGFMLQAKSECILVYTKLKITCLGFASFHVFGQFPSFKGRAWKNSSIFPATVNLSTV